MPAMREMIGPRLRVMFIVRRYPARAPGSVRWRTVPLFDSEHSFAQARTMAFWSRRGSHMKSCATRTTRLLHGSPALALPVLVCASPALAQNVSLGTAANFGVLAGSAGTNTGPTVVTGNVGVSPGSSITGFPPGSIAPGSGFLHSADSVAQQAQSDLTTAYNDAATRVCGTPIAGGVLGGLVLTPGVYCMGTGDLTGTLTLNGAGVYIFQ